MGGNAEENTAFRPMCFGTGAEGFCVIKKKKELKKCRFIYEQITADLN